MEVGPKTYIRQDNEKVILGPEKMIVVPPRHYCIVENPVIVGDDFKVVLDSYGQVNILFSPLLCNIFSGNMVLNPRGKKLNVPIMKTIANYR